MSAISFAIRRSALALALLALLFIAALVAVEPASERAFAKERSFAVTRDIDYSPGRSAGARSSDLLDVYEPRGLAQRARRPIVVWVHGGGWRRGDKRGNVGKKAQLFTSAGYVLVAINYRLSPMRFDPADPDPRRTIFPDHPNDVGEALGWVRRNAGDFGGDPRRIVLLGHSAGAHLVSLVATDPRYARRHGVEGRRIRGFVSLDSPAFDLAAAADPETSDRPRDNLEMIWNAFGTPDENERTDAWRRGSPLEYADRSDPPGLLITQEGETRHAADHRRMAEALRGRPGRTLLELSYDHREVNRMLGAGADVEGETRAVLRFVRRVVS